MSEEKSVRAGGRRGFLQSLAGIGSGAATAAVGYSVLGSTSAEAAEIPPVFAESTGLAVVRMQQDLERSLAAGRTPSWLMVVDTRKCAGCDACTIACKAENPTGPGGSFRRVVKTSVGPSVSPFSIFKPANCLQCDAPPCARAVPSSMISKRPDGIVEFNETLLKGPYAMAAQKACPFGMVQVDDGKTFTSSTPAQMPYEERPFVENGRAQTRKRGASTVMDAARKCTFCSHRLDVGLLPACVTTCIGGAMYFGDANDSRSLITEVTSGRRIFRGHQDFGVKPRVIYFEENMPGTQRVDCSSCHY